MLQASETEWVKFQEKVNALLVDILTKIEWYYGDNRSPFQYPAEFIVDEDNDDVRYACKINLDFSTKEEALVFKGACLGLLFDEIENSLRQSFEPE